MTIGDYSKIGYGYQNYVPSGLQNMAGKTDQTAQSGAEGIQAGKSTDRVAKAECQSCKERKYVDGSNEGNVSFKAPGHISPENSASAVMAHEGEHVKNAVAEGQKENKELLSVSVCLKTATCSECGTSYVSGGETRTTMRTYSKNPYDQSRKILEADFLKGQNIDLTL